MLNPAAAEILSGTAEAIPARDSSFDTVVIAQAFHWFEGDRALGEIHRVLKPGGKLGLIWNVRDESVDWVRKLTRIINTREGRVPRYRTHEWKKAFDRSSFFTPLGKKSFSHIQKGGIETCVARVKSISFISALPEAARKDVLGRVKELLEIHPQTRGRAEIEMPYRTDVY